MDDPDKTEEAEPEEDEEDLDFTGRILGHRMSKYRKYGLAVIFAAILILGFIVYDRLITYDAYTIAASYENAASAGTSYVAAGKNILKYNADGITCVSRNNDLKWNVTYSMQSAIADLCDTTLVVAEQHGTQIYVTGENGEIGHFNTDNPILKVRVSKQGVVAAMLQADDVTWVNLYQADGTLIASDKTTIMETGYPLDVDLSPNGESMAVSYLQITEGVLRGTVTFYNFGSAGQERDNHIVFSETYDGVMIPEIYFVDDSRAVAVTDSGYFVFRGSRQPKQVEAVSFEEEIVSCFHEDDAIGFVFVSDSEEGGFRMELYNLRGRRTMSAEMEFAYSNIKMEHGQILLYNDHSAAVYTSYGHLRFESDYEKEIEGMFYFSEYRKYLVVTTDSFDRIRIVNGGGA